MKKDLRIEGFEGLSEKDESVLPLDPSDPGILDPSTLRNAELGEPLKHAQEPRIANSGIRPKPRLLMFEWIATRVRVGFV